MSVIVTPLHAHYREEHLTRVIGQMRMLGAPRIKAHLDEESGAWMAYEGTHRLRAALWLGLTPIMLPRPWYRSQRALEDARFAAIQRGHVFQRVEVAS